MLSRNGTDELTAAADTLSAVALLAGDRLVTAWATPIALVHPGRYFGSRPEVKLAQDVLDVVGGRGLGDDHRLGDLTVAASGRDERRDLALAGIQAGELGVAWPRHPIGWGRVRRILPGVASGSSGDIARPEAQQVAKRASPSTARAAAAA